MKKKLGHKVSYSPIPYIFVHNAHCISVTGYYFHTFPECRIWWLSVLSQLFSYLICKVHLTFVEFRNIRILGNIAQGAMPYSCSGNSQNRNNHDDIFHVVDCCTHDIFGVGYSLNWHKDREVTTYASQCAFRAFYMDFNPFTQQSIRRPFGFCRFHGISRQVDSLNKCDTRDFVATEWAKWWY